jgi:hypothetical protein
MGLETQAGATSICAGPGTKLSLKKFRASNPSDSTQALRVAATIAGAPQQYTS